MKRNNSRVVNQLICCIVFALLPVWLVAQAESLGKPLVKLRYYNVNNSTQYLMLESMYKKGKVLTPRKDQSYDLYLDSCDAKHFVAKCTTDVTGKAKAFLPPGLQSVWNGSGQHTFIVKEGDEEIISDYAITKSKLTLDTINADGARSLVVTALQQVGQDWKPVPELELKAGVQVLGSILPAGTEPTYTTDADGKVTIEWKRDRLPGDLQGNLTLAAKVEENEQFGNVSTEMKAPWGIAQVEDNQFFQQRTLWATRLHTPLWLLFMAYSIVIAVWGTIIYLITQIVKIAKLGAAE